MQQLCDTEVEHLHRAGVGHEDVVGFEIAVDDVVGVRDGERAHHRDDELDRLRRWELAAVLQELRQRCALQVLEHHERVVGVLADFVNDDDVLVIAGRGRLGFENESRSELGMMIAVEQLDVIRRARRSGAAMVSRDRDDEQRAGGDLPEGTERDLLYEII